MSIPTGLEQLTAELDALRGLAADNPDLEVAVSSFAIGTGLRDGPTEGEPLEVMVTLMIDGRVHQIPIDAAISIGHSLAHVGAMAETIRDFVAVLRTTVGLDPEPIRSLVQEVLKHGGADQVPPGFEAMETLRAEYQDALTEIAREKDPEKSKELVEKLTADKRFRDVVESARTHWSS